jgi:phosphatidylglycerophosphatase A
VVRKALAYGLATCCGIGYSPLMPGTLASFLTVFILWIIQPLNVLILPVFLLILMPCALWAASYVEYETKQHDPSIIVIDEVIGMTIAVMGLRASIYVFLFAFLAFRFFDILKPFPINRTEILFSGGLGIIMDDVLAGLASSLCTLFFVWCCS